MIPHGTDTRRGASVHSVRARPRRGVGAHVDTGETTRLPGIWRPWTLTSGEDMRGPGKCHSGMTTSSDRQTPRGTLGFQHPVRSKAQQYLSHLGKEVLASFPVQATLHFYNDDSSSEDDEEEDDPKTKEA
ncbi:hypothetical protein Z043_107659 [Scleropages formosus]|uniref:Protein ripply3 n=1 Tax=Scleropages formosus TaxID=113540 RepID=A0A0P7UGC7_SCLFO|nr:hypothetical protein Z043_107659 [Scleropages formosus]